MNAIDKLIENTLMTKNPSVIGLDPDISKIPTCYKTDIKSSDPFEATAEAILSFNMDIIDTVAHIVPAVKPQMAFYEKYGSHGIQAFEKTVAYAKEKGIAVIEDAKRCDIGNTAKAYADGHLGQVALIDGTLRVSIDADFLTVTPFLGSDSLNPFIDVCKQYGKGIFVLVKTSNISSCEIQDVILPSGVTVSQSIAKYLSEQADSYTSKYGYSAIGAVVGATYPEEAATLRTLMPKSYFLVPGYGAQGGTAYDIVPCFNPDGLGAVVNSSRGILYNHMNEKERESCTREEYLLGVKSATGKMRDSIYTALKNSYHEMKY